MLLFSIIANIVLLLVSFPVWFAGTFLGWLVWYFNPDAHFGTFIVFQLVGFFFALPSMTMRGTNVGVRTIAAGAIGYIAGKKIAKL